MLGLDFDSFTLQTASKRENLSYNIGAPFGAHLDSVQDSLRVRFGDREFKDVDGHHDRGEDVLQVVCNAAGQRPKAFHTLCTHELSFDFFLLRDVSIDREYRFGMAFVVSNERPASLDGDLGTVFRKVLQFTLPFPLTKC